MNTFFGYATTWLRRARVRQFGLLLATSIFIVTSHVHAAPIVVYRWVDPESRQVHYSDTQSQSTAYEVVALAGSPPPDPEAARRLEAIEAATTRWASAQMRELELQQLDEADAATRGLDCERASRQLEKLNMRPGPRLRLVEVDGTARRMTEDERQERMADAEQLISTLCEGAR